ncbi:hypothetical protein AALC25_09150 [Lachnospiraceae bacterium 29-84]
MEKSQWYIGTPSGVVLCVDQKEQEQLNGRIYHAYSKEPEQFDGVEQLLFELERFYDSINFPHPGTNERTFQGDVQHANLKVERSKVMNDEELLSKHGDFGTFIIRVQHRQNSSWQGKITWMDKDKTLYFRSVWEMIKLIDSALDTVSEPKDDAERKRWED